MHKWLWYKYPAINLDDEVDCIISNLDDEAEYIRKCI